ncbi:hypothetical protein HK104_010725, partial [Borealophlyctis nickersoniae]
MSGGDGENIADVPPGSPPISGGTEHGIWNQQRMSTVSYPNEGSGYSSPQLPVDPLARSSVIADASASAAVQNMLSSVADDDPFVMQVLNLSTQRYREKAHDPKDRPKSVLASGSTQLSPAMSMTGLTAVDQSKGLSPSNSLVQPLSSSAVSSDVGSATSDTAVGPPAPVEDPAFNPSPDTLLRSSRCKHYFERRYTHLSLLERENIRWNPLAIVKWRKAMWQQAVRSGASAEEQKKWKMRFYTWHVGTSELIEYYQYQMQQAEERAAMQMNNIPKIIESTVAGDVSPPASLQGHKSVSLVAASDAEGARILPGRIEIPLQRTRSSDERSMPSRQTLSLTSDSVKSAGSSGQKRDSHLRPDDNVPDSTSKDRPRSVSLLSQFLSGTLPAHASVGAISDNITPPPPADIIMRNPSGPESDPKSSHKRSFSKQFLYSSSIQPPATTNVPVAFNVDEKSQGDTGTPRQRNDSKSGWRSSLEIPSSVSDGEIVDAEGRKKKRRSGFWNMMKEKQEEWELARRRRRGKRGKSEGLTDGDGRHDRDDSGNSDADSEEQGEGGRLMTEKGVSLKKGAPLRDVVDGRNRLPSPWHAITSGGPEQRSGPQNVATISLERTPRQGSPGLDKFDGTPSETNERPKMRRQNSSVSDSEVPSPALVDSRTVVDSRRPDSPWQNAYEGALQRSVRRSRSLDSRSRVRPESPTPSPTSSKALRNQKRPVTAEIKRGTTSVPTVNTSLARSTVHRAKSYEVGIRDSPLPYGQEGQQEDEAEFSEHAPPTPVRETARGTGSPITNLFDVVVLPPNVRGEQQAGYEDDSDGGAGGGRARGFRNIMQNIGRRKRRDDGNGQDGRGDGEDYVFGGAGSETEGYGRFKRRERKGKKRSGDTGDAGDARSQVPEWGEMTDKRDGGSPKTKRSKRNRRRRGKKGIDDVRESDGEGRKRRQKFNMRGLMGRIESPPPPPPRMDSSGFNAEEEWIANATRASTPWSDDHDDRRADWIDSDSVDGQEDDALGAEKLGKIHPRAASVSVEFPVSGSKRMARREDSSLTAVEQELLSRVASVAKRFETLLPSAEKYQSELMTELARYQDIAERYQVHVFQLAPTEGLDEYDFFSPAQQHVETPPNNTPTPVDRATRHTNFIRRLDTESPSPLTPSSMLLPPSGSASARAMFGESLPDPYALFEEPPKTRSEEDVEYALEKVERSISDMHETCEKIGERDARSDAQISDMVSRLDFLSEEINEEWSKRVKRVEDGVAQFDERPNGSGLFTELYYQLLAWLLAFLGFSIWTWFQIWKFARILLKGVRVVSPRTAAALVEAGEAAKTVAKAAAVAGRGGSSTTVPPEESASPVRASLEQTSRAAATSRLPAGSRHNSFGTGSFEKGPISTPPA